MAESVVIIGASGHGRVVADIILQSGDQVVGFLDDAVNQPDKIAGFPYLGTSEQYKKYCKNKFIIAVGNAKARKKIVEKLDNVQWYTAIHPSARISCLDVSIGEGSAIMANAVINSGATIGKHCIVNTSASVDHDCQIGNYVHISVGAHLAGTVYIGTRTWVGIGCTISNNLKVASDCMIGAGTVVVRNITEPGTYVGVPARKIK